MYKSSLSPREMFSSIWRNLDLIRALAKREVLSRYRGSMMGIMWSFITPTLSLAVYTFVFGNVLKSRWHGSSGSEADFALMLFSGLIIFNFFAECIIRAPTLISSNVNYVKKFVFPLEILPFTVMLNALFHGCVSFIVWLASYFLIVGIPNGTMLFFPFLIVPLIFITLGFMWILASLGVFLRDISQFIGVMITALMFLSPLFYPMSSIPDAYRSLLYLNPLTVPIELTHDVLFFSKPPELLSLGVYWSVTMIFAWLGFAWFQATRKGFADVL